MTQQRISISKANSVAELMVAITSLGFKGITPVSGDIVEGRVVFGRAQAFPTETVNGTKGVYRLSTNVVHDMTGFKAAFAQFKATQFANVDLARQAWYDLADKFICRANVWDDNADLNKLRLGGEFMGRLTLEEFVTRDGVPAKAWTVNGIISAGIQTAKATAFSLEDGVVTPQPQPQTVVIPQPQPAGVAAGAAGLDPNQVRHYNGQPTTVAVLRSSGWTDAQIEQYSTL